MFNDLSDLKYLVNKPVLGGKIFRWLLLFQEYEFEIIVKPERLNARPDHLSRIENGEEPTSLEEGLPDAQLFSIKVVIENFADIIHFLTTGTTPTEYSVQQKKELVAHAIDFTIIASQLYKLGTDEVFRRHVLQHERQDILAKAHGGVEGGRYAEGVSCRVMVAHIT